MSGYDENEILLDVLGPPDYDNSGEPIPWSNRPQTLMGLIITFLVLSWLFVTFRLYVRLRIVRSPWWDDLFVALYLICGSIGSIILLISIKFGTGRHLLTLTVGDAGRYLVAFYIFNSTLNLATTFIKLSLLFQYLRIFEQGSLVRRITKWVICFVSLWGFAYSLIAFVPCYPVSDFWYSPPDSKCWGYGSFSGDELASTFYSHTSLNMTLDLVILVIPFHLYFGKGMTFKMRVGLLALLFMGAIVSFLSVWRLQTIVEHQAGRYPVHDPTWYGPISLLLAALEVNCASICASVPIFWPVISPYLGTIFVTQEISVEHEYRDMYDEESKIRGSNLSRGSLTELKSLESRTTSNQVRDKEFYVSGHPDPLKSPGAKAPGSHTRIRSDGVREKKRPWVRM